MNGRLADPQRSPLDTCTLRALTRRLALFHRLSKTRNNNPLRQTRFVLRVCVAAPPFLPDQGVFLLEDRRRDKAASMSTKGKYTMAEVATKTTEEERWRALRRVP